MANSDSEPTTLSRPTVPVRHDPSDDENLGWEIAVTGFFLASIVALIVTVITLHFIFQTGHPTSFPPDAPHVGWVTNPDNRGTSNIIFSCLSTIFTCVYVSVHVDVADPTEYNWLPGSLSRRYPGSGGTSLFYAVRLFTKPVMRKVYWILFNISAPEFMILVAILEYWSASSGVAFMRSRGQDGWTMRHAFFADMGGFETEGGTMLRTGRQFYKWYDEQEPKPKLDYAKIEEEIRDRSKANVVLKMYTCAQASWLLVETVVRFARHQPVSELEVTTCSYVVCAIVTYTCWLRKPYSVDGRIALHPQRPKEELTDSQPAVPEDQAPSNLQWFISAIHNLLHRFISAILDILRRFSSAIHSIKSVVYTPIEDKEKLLAELPLPRMSHGEQQRITPFNRAFNDKGSAWLVASLAAILAGTVIGVIHAVPFWNARFPITEGKWIWRVCCGIQVVFPFALEVSMFILALLDLGRLLELTMVILMFIYGISRCALFALIFLSFKSQPVGVYRDVDWSWAAIPHWH